jgi:hypothetical protein
MAMIFVAYAVDPTSAAKVALSMAAAAMAAASMAPAANLALVIAPASIPVAVSQFAVIACGSAASSQVAWLFLGSCCLSSWVTCGAFLLLLQLKKAGL